ncbi:transmembrane protein 234-like protein [Globomyces pollinis-pini]|nr:transmembrane protein 234-like protein [Globomyces pollinis-pini]
MIVEHTIGFIAVSLCWGFTNPFIKRGTIGLDIVTSNHQDRHPIIQTAYQIKYLATRWQYVLPLALNLSGSTVYYYLLGDAELSVAVPITNSLSFVMTILAGALLGESKLGSIDLIGILLVIVGVIICVS